MFIHSFIHSFFCTWHEANLNGKFYALRILELGIPKARMCLAIAPHSQGGDGFLVGFVIQGVEGEHPAHPLEPGRISSQHLAHS